MKKIKVLAAAFATVLAMSFTSCNKDKDIDFVSFDLTPKTPYIASNVDVESATAAYYPSFTLGVQNDTLMAIDAISACREQFLAMFPSTSQFTCNDSIIDCGNAKYLADIKEIPTTGYGKFAVAEEGHGYVMKVTGAANLNSYNNPQVKDPEPMYVRLVVKEAIEGGYAIAIQYPFVIVEE